MGSPLVQATREPLVSAVAKPSEPLNVVCQPTRKLGLSNCLNLHARFVSKTYANGESISYAASLTEKQKDERLAQNGSSEINGGIAESDTNKDSKPTIEKYSSTRGEHNQNGLTSYAKRCMRILGHQYQQAIDQPNSTAKSCTFTTLTFRRIIPSTDQDGKDIFRAYLERVRRAKGNIKYVWVAEKQEGKTIKGVESYRKRMGQSVIHFHLLTPEQFGHEWVNTAWNETVANHFLKWEQINDLDHQKWMDELIMHNRYCKRLDKWRANERTTRPKPPPEN